MANNNFDVIIVGGSYSGLSAAMALGRSLREVLVIDGGKPCNRQTPHSHNFLTQDGETPKAISDKARQQVEKYKTVVFYDGLAVQGFKTIDGFEITTESNDTFTSKKLIFASGIKDRLPNIKGLSECWGISVIHCPYCHGYEVKHEKTGILGNGEYGFEFSKMISNWTKDLTLFTNGKSTLTKDQAESLQAHNIPIVETEIDSLVHTNGQLKHVVFKEGGTSAVKAMYAKVPFTQNSDIPISLGCELTEHGYITVDSFQRTKVPGLFVCGDSTSFMRSVSNAVTSGSFAGSMANKELIEEEF
ncbi:NAD(P)/FAD-dependent oxidoreductase [Flavivirga eckloniae]|uniref:Pyridine nucleotide-disulfide oxidoreductase n=1 Tax=Flavivirga eckloniae TaxID=1803846 RepID=A0A2K9PSL5_9FLAO|nr:NAD(P)/FAD-dependent oxidoreductase [Flavivirga eckloniae]AUP80054.1 pyridine nucleotide-disulfide oxidoreductase [Flavivirga eckloniae]